MSFLSFLSPAITAASDVAGGYEQGKERVAKEQIAQAVLAQKQKRQDALDVLNARNVNSEINARDNPTDKSIHIDQDGNAWRMEGGALVPVTTGQPKSATAPDAGGDINLGMNTSGPTKSADQGPSVAPPSQGKQSTAAPQTAPQGTAPKFGPKKEASTIPGTPEWKAAKIQEAKIANQYGYHPPVTGFTPVVTTAADGAQHVSAFGTKTGKLSDTGVIAKAASAGGGMGGSLTPQAMQAMYDQAAQADAVMRKYEDEYRAGKVQVHTGSQTLGAGVGAHSTGLTALLTGAEAAGSNAMLGLTDPRYQAYLTAQKRFGNIMGNLMSKRYSEYQGTLDTQLAGLSANDAAPTLDLKQSYRSDLLKHRPTAAGASAPPATGGTSGDVNLNKAPQTPGQLWDAAVAKHGKAKVLKEFGPRPAE